MMRTTLALLLTTCAAAHAQAAAAPTPQEAPSAAVPAAPVIGRNGMDVPVSGGVLRITALTDDILRIRLARDGKMPEDASWAVAPDVRARSVRVTAREDGFSTGSLRVRWSQGRMTIEDLAGKPILVDAPNPISVEGGKFTVRKAMPQAEHYFGMGDKTGGFDRRGQSFVNWNTDAYGYTTSTDPLYKTIPFFIGVGGEGGSYGLFLDNSWRTWFDFGHMDENVLSFGGPDGPIDYYFIKGPAPADVVRRYTDLTGRPSMPPLWALGYQQSRYSYMSADETREVATRLRENRIPTDVLWLDIDFQDRNRPFTTNPATFPDMKALTRDIGQEGFKLVTITDLHVAQVPGQGYAPYDSGMREDRFVRHADGSVYVAPVWPGPSVFPDFTQADSRKWWGDLFAKQVADGIAGSWNDMNEPAIFQTPTKTMPLDVRHRISSDDFAARTATHAEIHNVYGMLNTRATFEGLERLAPDKRPFVMTRATYSGGQRYAVTWTGDNLATWDHLKLSIHQILNLGLSGFAFSTADVSGFAGGPSPDLLTRWFEIGAFYPLFRNHSAQGTPRVEPWVDGPEHLAIRRRFIEERYKLLPYFYALADQSVRVGDPIMRPVFYDYPDALSMRCSQSMTFTLGRSLLVAPPPTPESPQAYNVCLPAGGWFDYWTGMPIEQPVSTGDTQIQSASQATGARFTASQMVKETPRLDRLPVFVRAGTILPRQPVVQNVEQTPDGPLQLDVYPGDQCRGDLYADAGDGPGYRKGIYLRQAIRCTATPDGLRIDFDRREGRYKPWWREMRVTVHGWRAPARVTYKGSTLSPQADASAQSISFTVPDQKAAATIAIATIQ